MWILGSNLEVVSFPDKPTWGAASYADKETLYQDELNLHKEIGKGIYGIIWSICVGNVHTSNKTSHMTCFSNIAIGMSLFLYLKETTRAGRSIYITSIRVMQSLPPKTLASCEARLCSTSFVYGVVEAIWFFGLFCCPSGGLVSLWIYDHTLKKVVTLGHPSLITLFLASKKTRGVMHAQEKPPN